MKVRRIAFFFIVAAMFMAPFLILGNHFVGVTKSLAGKNQLERAKLRLESLAAAAGNYLLSRHSAAEEARDSGFADWPVWRQKSFLRKKLSGSYRGFAVYRGSRKIFSLNGLDVPDGIVRKASASGLPMGSVSFSKDGPPALIVAEPLSGRTKVVFCYKIDLSWFVNTARNYNLPFGEIGVADAGGQIVADSSGRSIINPGEKLPGNIRHKINEMLFTGSSFGSLRYNGGKTLAVLRKIPDSQWFAYQISRYNEYDFYARWARKVVLYGVILIFVFSFITLKLAGNFLRPE